MDAILIPACMDRDFAVDFPLFFRSYHEHRALTLPISDTLLAETRAYTAIIQASTVFDSESKRLAALFLAKVEATSSAPPAYTGQAGNGQAELLPPPVPPPPIRRQSDTFASSGSGQPENLAYLVDMILRRFDCHERVLAIHQARALNAHHKGSPIYASSNPEVPLPAGITPIFENTKTLLNLSTDQIEDYITYLHSYVMGDALKCVPAAMQAPNPAQYPVRHFYRQVALRHLCLLLNIKL